MSPSPDIESPWPDADDPVYAPTGCDALRRPASAPSTSQGRAVHEMPPSSLVCSDGSGPPVKEVQLDEAASENSATLDDRASSGDVYRTRSSVHSEEWAELEAKAPKYDCKTLKKWYEMVKGDEPDLTRRQMLFALHSNEELFRVFVAQDWFEFEERIVSLRAQYTDEALAKAINAERIGMLKSGLDLLDKLAWEREEHKQHQALQTPVRQDSPEIPVRQNSPGKSPRHQHVLRKDRRQKTLEKGSLSRKIDLEVVMIYFKLQGILLEYSQATERNYKFERERTADEITKDCSLEVGGEEGEEDAFAPKTAGTRAGLKKGVRSLLTTMRLARRNSGSKSRPLE